MELNYFDLISSEPLVIKNVGSIHSPTIKEIWEITHDIYELYVGYLSMTPMKYCTDVNKKLVDWYENLTDEQLGDITMFDIATSLDDLQKLYSCIFDFFFMENVVFDADTATFVVYRENKESEKGFDITGTITKDNYNEICDLILQLNHIASKKNDFSKIKNKKGLKRMLELEKRKQEYQASAPNKRNDDVELGNIVSAVCCRSKTIGYHNVSCLTVYQIWDTFDRLQADTIFELNKTNVSVWGSKDNNKFNLNDWFKNIRKMVN